MRLFIATIILLLGSLITLANTVKLSDYATPNDSLDDSADMQTAVDAIPNGGTLIIDAGVWDIQAMVNFTPTAQNNSILVKGDKGAIIKPDLPGIMFNFSGHNQVTLQDLIFLGDGGTGADAGYVIVASGAQTRIIGCQFIGLRVTDSVIYLGNTDAVLKDDVFHGLSSIQVIEALNSRGLTVQDSEFFDYGNFNGTYYSKTSLGNLAWVKVSATAFPTPNANAQRGVTISNVRFDEGSKYAVDITNVRYVDISNINVNVSGVTGSSGVILDNVRLARIDRSMFGFTTSARAAMTLSNNTTVRVDGLTLGGGVFQVTKDSSSVAYISMCDNCVY